MAVSSPKLRLSGLARKLVTDGYLSEQDAHKAFDEALRDRIPFVSFIVAKKLVNSVDVAHAASHEFGFPLMDIDALELDPDVTKMVAEKLITFAKRGDLHARRMAARKVNEPAVLQKLFEEIGPRYAERPGGYTRIMRLGPRRGDNAELAILELVDNTARPKTTDSLKRKRARKILEAKEKAEAKAARDEAAEAAGGG